MDGHGGRPPSRPAWACARTTSTWRGEGRVAGSRPIAIQGLCGNVFDFVDFLRSVASYDVGRGASRICFNRIFIASISHIQTRLHAIGSNTELGVCASPAIAFLTDDRGAGMIAPRS